MWLHNEFWNCPYFAELLFKEMGCCCGVLFGESMNRCAD